MINIQDEVLEFIHRRFPTDSNWCCQNCYFFALILHNVFGGSVWYDVVMGHFITLIDDKYYDWTGVVEPDGYLVEWDKFEEYDSLQYKIIVRDCVM